MTCWCISSNDKDFTNELLFITQDKPWERQWTETARIIHFKYQVIDLKKCVYPKVEVIFYDGCNKNFICSNTQHNFPNLKRVYTNCTPPSDIHSALADDVLVIIQDNTYASLKHFRWGSNTKIASQDEFNQLWKNDVLSIEKGISLDI